METAYFDIGDGLKLYWKQWLVPEPEASVVLVHGLGEHLGRYVHVARFFNDRKINFLAWDRRGHGRSDGRRGHSGGFPDLIEEIRVFLELLRRSGDSGDLPTFLYGQSMGGNLVLQYALLEGTGLRGVIASDPWIRLAFQPSGIQVGLARVMSRVWPSFSQPNGLDVNMLSRDPKVVEEYVRDPLVHDRITASTGLAMMDSAARLDGFSGKVQVPVLLMHGEKDRITAPEASKAFSERVSGALTFREWKEGYHELHNEPNKEEVLLFAYDWIQKHLGK